MLEPLTAQLRDRAPLTAAQAAAAVRALADEAVRAEAKADFLIALASKGESAAEVAAFAHALREMSLPVPLDPATRQEEILDVVGTGGDQLGTFNISTCAALLAAAAGVRVAKHGNRAITSRAGSADVVEALGLPLDVSPEQAAALLRDRGFVFLFAPRYHPAFRHIAPARRLCAERGQRTVFNYLGPLLNPARPSAMLMGVPRPDLCEPMARVLRELGVRRAMVVCGRVDSGPEGRPTHIDELSTLGETVIAEFYQDRGFSVSTWSPGALPLQETSLTALRGGEGTANAVVLRQILNGNDRGPKRDAVLLNAGAALFVAGRTRSIVDGWQLAADLIDQGQASAKLAQVTAPL